MKYCILTIFLTVALSCKIDEGASPDTWINKMIEIGSDDTGKYISIYSYLYNSKNVYLFNYDVKCCDFFTAQLFDASGKSLCFPYGGKTGQGDLKCIDFDSNKKSEKLYWKK